MSELTKQQLARKRNYFKFVLMGFSKPVDKEALTVEEQSSWETILTARNELLKEFDNRSIIKGLRVPDKCWCGKEAKYEYSDEFYTGKVCKKHLHE